MEEELKTMVLAQASALASMLGRAQQAEHALQNMENKDEEIHDLKESLSIVLESRKALYTALGSLHDQDAALARIGYLKTKEAAYDKIQ